VPKSWKTEGSRFYFRWSQEIFLSLKLPDRLWCGSPSFLIVLSLEIQRPDHESDRLPLSPPFPPPHSSTGPCGPGSSHYQGFMITLRHTTLGGTPLEEWSARPTELVLTTHNTHKKQTLMLPPPPGGVRTPNSCNKAASNPHLRPFGQWDRHLHQAPSLKTGTCTPLLPRVSSRRDKGQIPLHLRTYLIIIIIIIIIITSLPTTGFDCWFFNIQVQLLSHKYYY